MTSDDVAGSGHNLQGCPCSCRASGVPGAERPGGRGSVSGLAPHCAPCLSRDVSVPSAGPLTGVGLATPWREAYTRPVVAAPEESARPWTGRPAARIYQKGLRRVLCKPLAARVKWGAVCSTRPWEHPEGLATGPAPQTLALRHAEDVQQWWPCRGIWVPERGRPLTRRGCPQGRRHHLPQLPGLRNGRSGTHLAWSLGHSRAPDAETVNARSTLRGDA